MSEIKSGGPAFPCETVGTDEHGEYRMPWQGMTLRDHFAAKALPAVYADYCESARKIGFDEGWTIGVALDAYAMADAMLAARVAELEAQIAKAREQKPVAWINHRTLADRVSVEFGRYYLSPAVSDEDDTPIFTSPIPAEPSTHGDSAAWLQWALNIIRERCPDVTGSVQFRRAEKANKADLSGIPAEPVRSKEKPFSRTCRAIETAYDRANGFKVED